MYGIDMYLIGMFSYVMAIIYVCRPRRGRNGYHIMQHAVFNDIGGDLRRIKMVGLM